MKLNIYYKVANEFLMQPVGRDVLDKALSENFIDGVPEAYENIKIEPAMGLTGVITMSMPYTFDMKGLMTDVRIDHVEVWRN